MRRVVLLVSLSMLLAACELANHPNFDATPTTDASPGGRGTGPACEAGTCCSIDGVCEPKRADGEPCDGLLPRNGPRRDGVPERLALHRPARQRPGLEARIPRCRPGT